MVFKNSNWKETDQLAIYKKRSQGVALGATEDKCSENQDGRLELGMTRLLAQRPNSLTATLPPLPSMIFSCNSLVQVISDVPYTDRWTGCPSSYDRLIWLVQRNPRVGIFSLKKKSFRKCSGTSLSMRDSVYTVMHCS